jgi:hypothetical protein
VADRLTLVGLPPIVRRHGEYGFESGGERWWEVTRGEVVLGVWDVLQWGSFLWNPSAA